MQKKTDGKTMGAAEAAGSGEVLIPAVHPFQGEAPGELPSKLPDEPHGAHSHPTHGNHRGDHGDHHGGDQASDPAGAQTGVEVAPDAAVNADGRAEDVDEGAGADAEAAAAQAKMNFLEQHCLRLLRLVLGDKPEIICQDKSLPGTPDFYIPKLKLVVMVDGSFWHGGRGERMRRVAIRFLADDNTKKASFWSDKALTNRERDKRVNKELRAMGLKVVRLKEEKLREDARDPLGYVSRAIHLCLLPSINAHRPDRKDRL